MGLCRDTGYGRPGSTLVLLDGPGLSWHMMAKRTSFPHSNLS
jgi:hypothetical protein